MIPASRAPSEYEWRRLHERLDRAIAEATRFYLQGLAARGVPINARNCSEELAELRLGREPDYDLPGLPLVYALKYTPRRVVSIFGSLLSVLDSWYPTSVLDIGSGTGATALALDLLNLPRHINLVGIEPSREMITFSERSRYRDRVSAVYRQGSISDVTSSNVRLEPFDLLVFSACLPYSFEDWSPLLTALGGYEGRESKMILAVEPDAKYELLTSFERQLRARGWPTVSFCCHDLPDVIKDDGFPLPNMLNVWWRLGLDDSSRPRTWWNPPDDKFLVANPNPAAPCTPLTVLSSAAKISAAAFGAGTAQVRKPKSWDVRAAAGYHQAAKGTANGRTVASLSKTRATCLALGGTQSALASRGANQGPEQVSCRLAVPAPSGWGIKRKVRLPRF